MLLTRVPIFVVLLVNVVGMVTFDDWQCGSEETSRQMAYDSVQENCPKFAAEMNHCCVVHDDCYVRQLGQEYCDKQFCECNDIVLNKTGGEGCRTHADLVCLILNILGHDAYEKSANYTEPADIPKYLPRGSMSKDYNKLYMSCSTVNSTLSSCALQYNECSWGYFYCPQQLCDCLDEAYRLDMTPECELAKNSICATGPTGIRDPSLKILTIMTLVSSCVLLISILTIYHFVKECEVKSKFYVPV